MVHLNKQKGVVIIMALFVVALVATMAAVMMASLMRDTERTALILRDTEKSHLAEGSIMWAEDVLRNDWNNKKPNQLVDQMPLSAPQQTVDGYQIKTTINDMQARFNINDLIDDKMQPAFIKLLKSLDKNMTDEGAATLSKSITLWLKPEKTEADKYYLSLPMPYRPAHRLMQNITELRLIKDMTPILYQALAPYLIALPKTALPVNIQTADAIVMSMLYPKLTVDAANALIKLRTQKPFVNPEAILQTDIARNFEITTSAKMTVISAYFLVETTISIENQQTVIYTLLERSGGEGKAVVKRLWQSKGVWS